MPNAPDPDSRCRMSTARHPKRTGWGAKVRCGSGPGLAYAERSCGPATIPGTPAPMGSHVTRAKPQIFTHIRTRVFRDPQALVSLLCVGTVCTSFTAAPLAPRMIGLSRIRTSTAARLIIRSAMVRHGRKCVTGIWYIRIAGSNRSNQSLSCSKIICCDLSSKSSNARRCPP